MNKLTLGKSTILALFTLLVVLGCSNSGFSNSLNNSVIRPISIQVIDADTNQPVRGLKVLYTVNLYELKKMLFVFPALEARGERRFLVNSEQLTDANGKVTFYYKDLKISKNEVLDSETIYINLDLNEDFQAKYKKLPQTNAFNKMKKFQTEFLTHSTSGGVNDSVVRPDERYKGYYILSANLKQGIFECGNLGWISVDFQCISSGLNKNEEALIIKLKRF